jgi:hypothetical protein
MIISLNIVKRFFFVTEFNIMFQWVNNVQYKLFILYTGIKEITPEHLVKNTKQAIWQYTVITVYYKWHYDKLCRPVL